MANMKKLQAENAVKRKDLLGNVEGGPAMASASSSSLMGSIGMGMFGTKRSQHLLLSWPPARFTRSCSCAFLLSAFIYPPLVFSL